MVVMLFMSDVGEVGIQAFPPEAPARLRQLADKAGGDQPLAEACFGDLQPKGWIPFINLSLSNGRIHSVGKGLFTKTSS